jgi:hypothetical protein
MDPMSWCSPRPKAVKAGGHVLSRKGRGSFSSGKKKVRGCGYVGLVAIGFLRIHGRHRDVPMASTDGKDPAFFPASQSSAVFTSVFEDNISI